MIFIFVDDRPSAIGILLKFTDESILWAISRSLPIFAIKSALRIVTLFIDATDGFSTSVGSKDLIDQILRFFFAELALIERINLIFTTNSSRDFCVVALLAQSIGCDKRIDLIRNRRCLGVEKVEEIALVVVSTSGNFDPEITVCIGV